MAWNKIGDFAALFLAFIFAACGGDSGNNAPASEMGESQSSNSKSNQSNVGDKSCEDLSFLSTWDGCFCDDGIWACDLSISSSSTPLSSSSLCDFCEDEKKSSSSSGAQDDELVLTQIVNKTISGLAQKGPFDVGSTVSLSQFDSKTFLQTGSNYTGKVANTSGAFEISNITLSSPYVTIQANGSYRSEITGKFTSGKITLKSFADLSNQSNVNINVLTHLANKRIAYLVSKGTNFSDAKKQAEGEVLKIFGIKDDVKNFEGLNLFGKNNGSAVLMAISIMMQRDLNIADINSLLSEFETNFEKTGKWDESAQAKIADWSSTKDLTDGLDSIRKNIEKRKLGTVPDFEKYIRNYWYDSYGLGACSKSREGEVHADTNKFSSNYEKKVRYICKDSAWRKASYFEMDTYKWEKGEDGEMRTGNVWQTSVYIYDAELGEWRSRTFEEELFGACILSNVGEVSRYKDRWYICKSRVWGLADTIEVDTQGWSEGADGEIKKGDSTDVFYKYDEVLNKWMTANKNDTTLKLNGCTTKQEGEVKNSQTDASYYKCKDLRWNGLDEVWIWGISIENYLNPSISYGTMTDYRDGKTYRTVKIGNLEWMAENLNYADSAEMKSLLHRSWCFNNAVANCGLGGRLYTWAAAKDSVQIAKDLIEYYSGVVVQEPIKGCGYGVYCGHMTGSPSVCPAGWRLPLKAEFIKLSNSLGGGKGKSLKGWNDGNNGTDNYGFSALPVGMRDDAGGFIQYGYGTCFWSAEEVGAGSCSGSDCNYAATHANILCFGEIYGEHRIDQSAVNKKYGLPVRCVK